jgi:hypothetical protein
MDYRQIEKAAREQGWRVARTRKGAMFYPPDPEREAVTVHGTPSDRRALNNFLARMRRSGLVWPWPPRRGRER